MWERTVRCVFRGITERMRSERECVRFGSNNDNEKNNGRVEENETNRGRAEYSGRKAKNNTGEGDARWW